MNILQALLQGSRGGMVPGIDGRMVPGPVSGNRNVLSLSGDDGGDIPVTAPKQRSLPPEDLRSPPNDIKTGELIPRKGMFGVKGTLRDVLGALGDSFLIGSGKQAIYRPGREQEKLASALYGYSEDPRAAAERVGILNPQMGYEMQNDLDQREVMAKRYEAMARQQQLAQADKGYKIRAAFAGTLKDAASYAKGLPTLKKISERYGLDGDIPDTYDAAAVSQLYDQGIDPVNRERLIDADNRQAVQTRQGDERNEISRIRANRPPASRPAPRTTQSNVDAEVSAAVANGTATPNQKAYWNARLVKGDGKGSTKRTPPPLPPGFVIKQR